MNWKLPNQLTVGRIGLAALFFVLLGLYDQGPASPVLMNVALAVLALAALTDFLDGHLARRWDLTSVFGRIADPFVDKVLVVGAFAMLSAVNFAFGPLAGDFERGLPRWLTGTMASAVQGWMVVVVLAREFVVSAVRGYAESIGIKFPAKQAGKIKMVIQTAAIAAVLVQLGNFPHSPAWIVVKIALVWLAVIVTVVSGLAYAGQARRILLGELKGQPGATDQARKP